MEKAARQLSPAQTTKVHKNVIAALCRGMGGRLIARIPNTTTNETIITSVTDLKNGKLDVEIILIEGPST